MHVSSCISLSSRCKIPTKSTNEQVAYHVHNAWASVGLALWGKRFQATKYESVRARVVCLSARVRNDSGDIRGCRTSLGFVCISFPRDDHARVLMWLAAHTIIGFRLDFDVQPQLTCFTWTLSVDTCARLVAKRAKAKSTRAKALVFLGAASCARSGNEYARCPLCRAQVRA